MGTFRVTQPGSSVATSLVAGEAVCKKVGILDVRESNFRLQPIPLTQVRSFVMGSVDLAREPRLDPDDSKVDVKVAKVLEDKVRVLILNAQEKREELLLAAKDAGNVLARHFVGEDDSAFPLKHTLNKPEEVLVRLKVDHTGFSVVNNQRFGAKFVGQVANPVSCCCFVDCCRIFLAAILYLTRTILIDYHLLIHFTGLLLDGYSSIPSRED